jgi:hypothetical protein
MTAEARLVTVEPGGEFPVIADLTGNFSFFLVENLAFFQDFCF